MITDNKYPFAAYSKKHAFKLLYSYAEGYTDVSRLPEHADIETISYLSDLGFITATDVHPYYEITFKGLWYIHTVRSTL